jgi:peptidyl-prolyl cis-trans isomerase C
MQKKIAGILSSMLFMLPLFAVGNAEQPAAQAQAPGTTIDSDVIARVGDQSITFREINVAMNSSAIVGLSVPALGTPERDTARIVVLDRFVSANLLYLDALKQGTDQDPQYRRTISRFSNAILAGLYRKYIQAGEIPVSDEEVQAWFKENVKAGTELTDDVRLQIESRLRREKLHQRVAVAEETLRDGINIKVYEENLSSEGDATRADSAPLADVGDETITWGELKDRIIAAGKGATKTDALAFESEGRSKALENEIDVRIMVQKARAAGLEQDRLYKKRMGEYSKTLLTNLHRSKVAKSYEPTEQVLREWYDTNRDRFLIPEARKLQMVVVKDGKQAEDIKARIDAGEITLYEAARDFSIAADAGRNLGEVGWVNQGELAADLDNAVFMLGPGELSEPVESPAGWHIAKVLDVRDAKYTDFNEEETRKLVRRDYLKKKVDEYTAELRKSQFPVEVYQERLVALEQQEADMVKDLAAKSHEPGSVTEQRIKELNKLARPPM